MPNKKTPLYNYKSPRDYTVFNMGNEASPPFKMKGSPMQRNFGIGSPVKQDEKSLPDATPSKEQQKLHDALTSTTSEKTIKEAEDFGNLIKKKIKEYKK